MRKLFASDVSRRKMSKYNTIHIGDYSMIRIIEMVYRIYSDL